MEKTIEFKIPEGYVFDKDNSTENVIRFKPAKKKIKYHNIAEKLFLNKITYFVSIDGEVSSHILTGNPSMANNATSKQQWEQLLALNKLMNVAKYLNGDWVPNFANRSEQKWYIDYNFEDSMLGTDFIYFYKHSHVYFKSQKLAKQAIEILGEEEVKKALGIFE